MKLFDVADRFKPLLNFNRNNFYNISTKIQRQYKNAVNQSNDQDSPKTGWIKEKVMLSVCQPTRNPAPLDLGHLVSDQTKPKSCHSDRQYADRDLLGMGTFGPIPAVPTTTLEEERNTQSFDRIDEAKQLRSSVFELGIFSPSYSLQQVHLGQQTLTLSIGSSSREAVTLPPPNLLPVITTPESSALNNPSIGLLDAASIPSVDAFLSPIVSLTERPTSNAVVLSNVPPTILSATPSLIAASHNSLPMVPAPIQQAIQSAVSVSLTLSQGRFSSLATDIGSVTSYCDERLGISEVLSLGSFCGIAAAVPSVRSEVRRSAAIESELMALIETPEGTPPLPAAIQQNRRSLYGKVPPPAPAGHGTEIGNLSGITAAIPSAKSSGGRSADLEYQLMALIETPKSASPLPVAIQQNRRSLYGEVPPPPPAGHGTEIGNLSGITAAIPSAKSSGGRSADLEYQLMALIESPEDVALPPAAIQPDRSLYGEVLPPVAHSTAVMGYRPFTTNRSEGVSYVYEESHYNFCVRGHKIETVDAAVDILSIADFIFQINQDTGIINVIGSGMFGAVSRNAAYP
ncbi:uncharacterized protein LOC117338886 [Pecten maximus]|uniref:uncharacterized protein LOC117338886 n=1 Tax=Pecten maximus TaxID=6579 RepID=UPI001458FBC7|nr:uncharacterized protein LOC117338886 [Pecten maximus]